MNDKAKRHQAVLKAFNAAYKQLQADNLALKSVVMAGEAGIIELKQRDADYAAVIATKDELLEMQAKRLIEMQTALEQALSMPADTTALEMEQAKRLKLEEELKAIQATAAASDSDRAAAIEQLAVLTVERDELAIKQAVIQEELTVANAAIAEDAANDLAVGEQVDAMAEVINFADAGA
jgi:chromosome segregation ATPase